MGATGTPVRGEGSAGEAKTTSSVRQERGKKWRQAATVRGAPPAPDSGCHVGRCGWQPARQPRAAAALLLAALAAKQAAVGEAVPLAGQRHEESGHACTGRRQCVDVDDDEGAPGAGGLAERLPGPVDAAVGDVRQWAKAITHKVAMLGGC